MPTLTIDPTVDSYKEATDLLARVYGVTAEEHEETAPEEGATDGDFPAEVVANSTRWTLPKMRRYVAALTDTGRKALRIIADGAPQVEVATVRAGLYAPSFAGVMSTFGHAARGTRGVTYAPFERQGDFYRINPYVAAMARIALDEVAA